jgi:hypothetical protein
MTSLAIHTFEYASWTRARYFQSCQDCAFLKSNVYLSCSLTHCLSYCDDLSVPRIPLYSYEIALSADMKEVTSLMIGLWNYRPCIEMLLCHFMVAGMIPDSVAVLPLFLYN